MRMYDIIDKKRNGYSLSEEEIRFFIQGYTDGSIPDYQASALCMAIYFRGMDDQEISILTDAMAHSGDTVDLSRFGNLSADKHSTGGVGDKTSLIVIPVVASLGAKLAKMSGRGLGHTGGTVDKLESIPGYQTAMDGETFMQQVEKVGLAIVGQSGNLTPADKKLYALRDVTATVDSIPLITSSIMSKKLAAGAHNIVLDVKVGSGAFMKTPEQARELAVKMVTIGKLCGRNIAAVLSNMDVPLGTHIGNALEVKEALGVLRGEIHNDLREVCEVLASNLIAMVLGISLEDAEARVKEAIDSGAAYKKMREWIQAQGGDIRYIDDPSLFPDSKICYQVISPRDGFIEAMDAESIGLASVTLRAGREKKEDPIDYAAGIVLCKKVGDYVRGGEPLCLFYTDREEALASAEAKYLSALTFGEEKPAEKPLIYEVIH